MTKGVEERIPPARGNSAGGKGKTVLFAEEERVERDGFGQRHADDALDENLRRGTGIAADGFGGLEADESDADGGAEAAEASLDAARDFSECVDHDGLYFCWLECRRPRAWHGPDGKGRRIVNAPSRGHPRGGHLRGCR